MKLKVVIIVDVLIAKSILIERIERCLGIYYNGSDDEEDMDNFIDRHYMKYKMNEHEHGNEDGW